MSAFNPYIACVDELPPEGEIVITKIDDENGIRNEGEKLKRSGRLWFHITGDMYVYYTPTHWKYNYNATGLMDWLESNEEE